MQKYSHSGIVPVSAALTTVMTGLATAVIGGVVYAFAAYWLNIGFIRFLLMLGFSFLLGGMIAWAANRGKIRSPLFVTAVALVCVAIGLWVYWGAYDVARNGPGVAASAWTPAGLERHARDLFVNGSWTVKGRRPITGWLLVGFWVVEGFAVTYMVVAAAREDVYRPFCETCLQWTNSTKGLMHLASDGAEPAWQEVLAGDLPAIATFAPTTESATPHVRLDLSHCPQCQNSNFVSLTKVTITRNSKGKTKTHESTLMRNGQITDVEAEFLRQFSQQQGGGAPPDAANQAAPPDPADPGDEA